MVLVRHVGFAVKSSYSTWELYFYVPNMILIFNSISLVLSYELRLSRLNVLALNCLFWTKFWRFGG